MDDNDLMRQLGLLVALRRANLKLIPPDRQGAALLMTEIDEHLDKMLALDIFSPAGTPRTG